MPHGSSVCHITTVGTVGIVTLKQLGYQGSRDQARGRQSFRRGGRRREAENRGVHRASTFLRRRIGRQRLGYLRWTVPVGKRFWLPPTSQAWSATNSSSPMW